MPKIPLDPHQEAADAWKDSFDPATWFDAGYPAPDKSLPRSYGPLAPAASFEIREGPAPPSPLPPPEPLPTPDDGPRMPPPPDMDRTGVYRLWPRSRYVPGQRPVELYPGFDGVYRTAPQPEAAPEPEPFSAYAGLPVAYSFGIKECACGGTCGGCGGA